MGDWLNRYNDILHIYFSHYVRELPEPELEKIAPARITLRFKKIARILFRRTLNLFRRTLSGEDVQKLKGKTWLFAMSLNNKRALDFLHEAMEDVVYVLDKKRPEFTGVRDVVVPVLRLQFFYSLFFCYLYMRMRLKYGPYVSRFSVVLFKSCGYYEEWIRILRFAKPKAIVFTNDHNIESRALLLAANSLGIKTIYIQHASVSTSFPPLRFGLSLLEGQDALDKYKAIGPISGEVELVGMPKFDSYVSSRRTRGVIHRIGIPYNLNDDPEEIRTLIRNLHDVYPYKQVTLRRHPKDKSRIDYSKEFTFIVLSDPALENPFDFLLKQDLIIAGNSSIHLESTLLNIPSIYFNFLRAAFIDDYYGYVRNNLVRRADTAQGLIQIIKEFDTTQSDVWPRAQYFNALVGNKEEGKSQKLVIHYLQQYLQSS